MKGYAVKGILEMLAKGSLTIPQAGEIIHEMIEDAWGRGYQEGRQDERVNHAKESISERFIVGVPDCQELCVINYFQICSTKYSCLWDLWILLC